MDFNVNDELVSSCQMGQQAACEEICLQSRIVAAKFAYLFLQSAHLEQDAEDVAQEISLKIYRNIDKYQPVSGKSFNHWASRVAKNYCIDYWRRFHKKTIIDFAVNRDLVNQCLGNDTQRLQELYDRCNSRARGFITTINDDHAISMFIDEIADKAASRICNSLNELKPRQSFDIWATKIVEAEYLRCLSSATESSLKTPDRVRISDVPLGLDQEEEKLFLSRDSVLASESSETNDSLDFKKMFKAILDVNEPYKFMTLIMKKSIGYKDDELIQMFSPHSLSELSLEFERRCMAAFSWEGADVFSGLKVMLAVSDDCVCLDNDELTDLKELLDICRLEEGQKESLVKTLIEEMGHDGQDPRRLAEKIYGEFLVKKEAPRVSSSDVITRARNRIQMWCRSVENNSRKVIIEMGMND